ncbi:permease prefix domain 1-containing protein [Nocardioides nematodiphilus]|uniref:permease prefix domain 1-containing protein n=1 Tax=Nocardioides nematodiphilus TaxID=2849669 RepID=UPI001CD9221E|nr:permease prefix domain 1-containing protein [Nocardioides nematodiphilus]MCA1983546.1 permease prefix domain 1-containing protein [Nocardioides nematodiphilus]
MGIEEEFARWRAYASAQPTLAADDIAEMEGHLQDQVADLAAAGLDDDEAFLIAIKRMGRVDDISREFARVHSERLWKQLLPVAEPAGPERREVAVVLALAVGAALVVRLGIALLPDEVALRLAAVGVLPFLTAYFAWKRRLRPPVAGVLTAVFVVSGLLLGLLPFDDGGATGVLAILHAPVALWLTVGIAYAGGDWRSHERRMDFVRFTGEWIVYYTLIALGGGVLVGLTAGIFNAIGVDPTTVLATWVLPCGAAGAVLVAAWLVEAKQAVIENIAPVLTLVFTPLTLALLIAVLGGFIARPRVIDGGRDLLVLMALILVLVLGLWLYAVSARAPERAAGLFDRLQVAMLVAAIGVDLIVLVAMTARIAEFGASANKVAALGLNLVILVNLVRSAWLGGRFALGRGSLVELERWQTTYLPLYGVWAAAVVCVLPPVFGFA